MIKNFILFYFVMFSVAACTPKKQKIENTHTYKLQKKISLSFIDTQNIRIDYAEDYKGLVLKIFLKKNKNKKLVQKIEITHPGIASLNLPDDLSEYGYVIAVLEGADFQSNPISSVDTYKIGEQDQINQAKDELKNRN